MKKKHLHKANEKIIHKANEKIIHKANEKIIRLERTPKGNPLEFHFELLSGFVPPKGGGMSISVYI